MKGLGEKVTLNIIVSSSAGMFSFKRFSEPEISSQTCAILGSPSFTSETKFIYWKREVQSHEWWGVEANLAAETKR